MRLYSLTNATAVDAPEGHFEAGEDGGFDFPGALSARLHGVAVAGRRQWETDVERQHRLIAEEAARRQDPATLLAAVEQLVQAARTTPPADQVPAARPGAGGEVHAAGSQPGPAAPPAEPPKGRSTRTAKPKA